MAKLERTYNVPLRSGYINTPKYKRAKKAVTTLKTFLSKHMKSEEIKLGQHLNKEIWSKGIRNPPHHVKVTAVKDDDGVVKAELSGYEFTVTMAMEEKVVDEGLAAKLTEKLGGKKKEDKPVEEKTEPEVTTEKKETEKKVEKKETKKPTKKTEKTKPKATTKAETKPKSKKSSSTGKAQTKKSQTSKKSS